MSLLKVAVSASLKDQLKPIADKMRSETSSVSNVAGQVKDLALKHKGKLAAGAALAGGALAIKALGKKKEE